MNMDVWMSRQAMTIPASAGATTRVTFQTIESIATALTICSVRTKRGETLDRLGASKACTAPMMTPAARMCQVCTCSLRTSTASATTTVAETA